MTICKQCISNNENFWDTAYWWKIIACITNSKGEHHSFNDQPAVIYETGCSWYLNGKLHRISNPAIINDEAEQWFLNGKLHRTDGPAIIKENGDKEWFYYGSLHRKDGPAIEYVNGHKEWILYGKLHRTNGPAIECSNGDKSWYLNGLRHKTDGPAIEYFNGYDEWWLNGKEPFIIKDQKITIGGQVEIQDKIAIVLKQVNKKLFIILLGNQKIFIQTTFFTKYRFFFKKCLTFFTGMI